MVTVREIAGVTLRSRLPTATSTLTIPGMRLNVGSKDHFFRHNKTSQLWWHHPQLRVPLGCWPLCLTSAVTSLPTHHRGLKLPHSHEGKDDISLSLGCWHILRNQMWASLYCKGRVSWNIKKIFKKTFLGTHEHPMRHQDVGQNQGRGRINLSSSAFLESINDGNLIIPTG